MTGRNARVVAHYLPQFHPIPENDRWWGPGFTEWTNVAGADPLFRGHQQPDLPGELGFYDLRLPESRQAQADLALQHGVEAFCYWHYWFAGTQILERPFAEVLASGEPDFPFCVAWANHSWTRTWAGRDKEILIEQTYPGREDYRAHFASLESAFHDPRYLLLDGKPLFFLFRPNEIPDLDATVELWNELAVQSGFPGLHIVGRVEGFWQHAEARRVAQSLDGVVDYSLGYVFPEVTKSKIVRRLRRKPKTAEYAAAVDTIPRLFDGAHSYPTLLTGWDTTPRHGRRASVLVNKNPALFETMARNAVSLVRDRPAQDRLVFLKSWNEWAEGNFIEPDRVWRRQFLEALDRATRTYP